MTASESADGKRAAALLRLKSYGDAVTAIDPNPSAADLDAAEAFGYEFSPTGVVAVVYSLFDEDDLDGAEKRLRAGAPDGQAVATTANGLLLLYATADGSDPAATELLETLTGDFAGRE